MMTKRMADRPRTITQEQWDKLKKGDVLVSPLGKERAILEKDGALITLAPINCSAKNQKKNRHVTLGKCDLWRTYRVKGAPACGEPSNVNKLDVMMMPQKPTEHCALQFIRAVLIEYPLAVPTSDFMLAKFSTELRKYLR